MVLPCVIVCLSLRMKSLVEKFRINCTDINVIDSINVPPSADR